MTVIKGKWKALLVLNYISAVIWLLMLLVFLLMFWQAKNGGAPVKSNVIVIAIGGGVLLLFNIFYIYVLKTYFPSRRLSGVTKFLYIAGLVFIGVIALLFIGLLSFSTYDTFSNSSVDIDIYSIVATSFFLIFSFLNLFLFIWHFQLIDVLSRNSEENVKSVLDSIGIDDNNSIV